MPAWAQSRACMKYFEITWENHLRKSLGGEVNLDLDFLQCFSFLKGKSDFLTFQ